MRAFDDGRVACSVVPGLGGAGDAMPAPLAKIVLIIGGDDEYTAAGLAVCRGVVGGVGVLPVLLACPRVVGVLLVVE